METSEQEKQTSANWANIHKIEMFLENNSNNKPSLSSSVPLLELLRMYLNDDDFAIYYCGQIVFKNREYQDKLLAYYKQWRKNATDRENIDEFILYWVKRQKSINVQYWVFDQREEERKGMQQHWFGVNGHDLQNEDEKDGVIQTAFKNSNAIQVLKSRVAQENDVVRRQLLRHFFVCYCKMSVNNINSSTFDRYQRYYNEMNLTKWMCYVKEMGLTSFKKLFNNGRFKQVFIKHENQNKCLQFEQFYAAVHYVLNAIYHGNAELIEREGYELIGIRDYQNFKNKFRSLNILPPSVNIKKIKARRLGEKNETLASNKSLLSSNVCQSKISLASDDIEKAKKIKKKLKASAVKIHLSKTQPQASGQNLQNSQLVESSANVDKTQAVTTRRHIKLRMHEQPLKQMMTHQDEDDPYLKRYNNKQNLNIYHSILHRIDERVEKMCAKY